MIPLASTLFGGGPCTEDTTADTLSRCKRTPDIVLSGANLSASSAYVKGTGVGSGVRGLQGKSTGKWYFEFTTGTAGFVAGNPIQYGLCTAAATLGTGPTDACFIQNNSSFMNVTCNGTAYGQPGANCSLPATAGIVGIAVDLDARLFWAKSYNSSGNAVGKQWNINLNGDPALATGSVDLSVLSSATLYPFIGMRTSGSGGGVGTMGTFNPTSSVVHAAPSGFTAGW